MQVSQYKRTQFTHLVVTGFLLGMLGPVCPASAEVKRYQLERSTYDVYTPSAYSAAKEWPVVFAFHWSTGRSTSMMSLWKEAAERHGFLLVAPNSRHRMRWSRKDATAVQGMLGAVLGHYSVDLGRVYATGFSSGANFTYRMLLENPGVFRAIGPFGGRLLSRSGEYEAFDQTSNTRVCVFHGTRDKTIPHKHARRARMRLRAQGFEVIERDYRQGHWLRRGYAEEMWQCLNGRPVDGES